MWELIKWVWLFVRPLLAIAAAHPPLLRALTPLQETPDHGWCLPAAAALFSHLSRLPASTSKKKCGSVGISRSFLFLFLETRYRRSDRNKC
jgi:hypothetical protein